MSCPRSCAGHPCPSAPPQVRPRSATQGSPARWVGSQGVASRYCNLMAEQVQKIVRMFRRLGVKLKVVK